MPAVAPLYWFMLTFAILIAALLGWLLARSRYSTQVQQQREALHAELNSAHTALARSQEQHRHAEQAHQHSAEQLHSLQQQLQAALTRLTSAETENRQLPPLQQALQQEQQHTRSLTAQQQHLHGQLAAAQQQLQHWHSRETEWQQLSDDYRQLQQQHADTQLAHERLHTQLQQEREAQAEKLALLTEAREALSNQFKSLANDILEEKSKRFAEQNQTSLGLLLNPLHERMHGFSQLIQNTYEKEAKERSSLETELKRLQLLNTQLHTDAKALTNALTGTQNKNQGNWGEMILEKVLESSGLQKGREYILQAAASHTDEHGHTRRLQPDVLVNLPDNKQIIIDAKVSLTAYVRYTQAADADTAARELAAHVQSVRTHIRQLSAKQYSDIEGLNTLDFVFLFIPVEPAYLLALQQDNQLFDECFSKRIMLVGPSTLLATLRTVANIWRNEQQNQNALLIAKEGGNLYDKFVGFVSTLESVGKNIEQAQNQYQVAMKQLSSGRGNLINRADKLRQLGVKAAKTLPKEYQAEETDEEENAMLPGSLASTDEATNQSDA